MYNLDPKDVSTYSKLKDKKIVVPKENSRLHNYAKNSETMERWVAENYDKIKNGEAPGKDSIEFPMKWYEIFNNPKRGLYGTIHNSSLKNIDIKPDGSLYSELTDPDNYEEWENNVPMRREDGTFRNPLNVWKYNKFARLNNRAKEQQDANQLENLLFSIPVNYTKEEIEELKRKYKIK